MKLSAVDAARFGTQEHSPLSADRRWHAIGFPASVYLVSRLLALGAATLARDLLAKRHETLVQFLTQWDAGEYLRIARFGYGSHLTRSNGRVLGSEHAFFPGYPFVVRIFDPIIPGSLAFGAIVVSLIAGGLAAVLLWRLAERLSGAAIADRTVLLFCFFPGTIAFLWPYSEGVTLALCCLAILFLIDDRWLIASIVTACATATRSNTMPIAVACGWVAWNAARGPLITRISRAAAAFAIGVSGFVAFIAWVGFHVHDHLAWFRVEHQAWGEGFTWKQFPRTFRDMLFHGATFNRDVTVVFFGVMCVFIWATFASRQAGWLKLISLGAFYFAVTAHIAQVSPRLQLVAVPAFVALGEKVRGNVLVVVVAAFAILSAMLIFAYASAGPPLYMFAP